MKKFGLGRHYSPDERDRNFPMRALIPVEREEKKFKYWCPTQWYGNQGSTPQCVGYSWVHWLAEGPFTQIRARSRNKGVAYDPSQLYHQAQRVDKWPGENYDGTSVRAGAKVLRSNGFISTYRWAWNIEDVVEVLLYVSPVVVGTYWMYNMFFPDNKGIISLGGSLSGGHAYLLDGINVEKGLIRIKNSWGREWGNKGFAYIRIEDMEWLISMNGEACIAQEVEK